MRLNCTRTSALGATLLGLAMGTLVVGFALFLMPAPLAVRTPQTWIFAIITAVVVTLMTAKPLAENRRGHDV